MIRKGSRLASERDTLLFPKMFLLESLYDDLFHAKGRKPLRASGRLT